MSTELAQIHQLIRTGMALFDEADKRLSAVVESQKPPVQLELRAAPPAHPLKYQDGKLTPAGIRVCIDRLTAGVQSCDIARELGITQSAVSYRKSRWQKAVRREQKRASLIAAAQSAD